MALNYNQLIDLHSGDRQTMEQLGITEEEVNNLVHHYNDYAHINNVSPITPNIARFMIYIHNLLPTNRIPYTDAMNLTLHNVMQEAYNRWKTSPEAANILSIINSHPRYESFTYPAIHTNLISDLEDSELDFLLVQTEPSNFFSLVKLFGKEVYKIRDDLLTANNLLDENDYSLIFTTPEDDEYEYDDDAYRENAFTLAGGISRKSRKSRKFRKTRKSRKFRKTRKSRK